MGYGEPGWEWDTKEQVDMFDEYVKETADLVGRSRNFEAFGYSEAEWEAFCYGWNAAKEICWMRMLQNERTNPTTC